MTRPTKAHPIAIPATAPVEIPDEDGETADGALGVEVGRLLVTVSVFDVVVVVPPEVTEVPGVGVACVDDGVEIDVAVELEAMVIGPVKPAGQGAAIPLARYCPNVPVPVTVALVAVW